MWIHRILNSRVQLKNRLCLVMPALDLVVLFSVVLFSVRYQPFSLSVSMVTSRQCSIFRAWYQCHCLAREWSCLKICLRFEWITCAGRALWHATKSNMSKLPSPAKLCCVSISSISSPYFLWFLCVTRLWLEYLLCAKVILLCPVCLPFLVNMHYSSCKSQKENPSKWHLSVNTNVWSNRIDLLWIVYICGACVTFGINRTWVKTYRRMLCHMIGLE